MPRRLMSLAVLALALLVAPPTAAQAVGLSAFGISDARGDVLKTTNPNKPEVVAPEQQHGDIQRTFVRHAAHGITVRMKLVDLQRTGDWFQATARLRTNAGIVRTATVIAGPRKLMGPRGWRGDTFVTRGNGPEVKCAGVAHKINYDTNAISMHIPRSCLGNPRWVQARPTFISSTSGQAPAMYIDGAAPGRKGVRFWTPRLHQ